MKIDRQRILNKLGGRCGYCGCEIDVKSMQIDHIVPIYRNCTNEELERLNIVRGTNEYSNLMPSCKSCNKYKGVFTVEVFRNEMQKQVERLNKYSTNYFFAKKFGLVEETNAPVVFYFEKYDKD